MADNAIYDRLKPRNSMEKLQQLAALEQTFQNIDVSKFELAQRQMNALANVTASFLVDPDAGKVDLTKKIQDEATKLAGMGTYSPQQVVQFLKGFPKDPTEQYKTLQMIHARTLTASEQLDAMLGALRPVDTGPGEITTQTPRYPGLPTRERSYLHKGLPPQTTVPNPETQQPEYLGTGAPPRVEQRGGSLTPVPPGVPVSRPAPGASRLTPSAPPVVPPPSPPASAAPPAPTASGRTPAAFPMGEPEAASGSGKQVAEERDAAGSYQERVYPLRGAIEILSKMKDNEIGPGTEQFNTLKSAAQTWGLGEIAGIDPNKVADFNKLRKYFEDAAARRVSAVGGPRTNDGLASALKATPNVGLDKLSALELVKLNLAIDRMRQAAILEFDTLKPAVPAGKFASWRANWMTQQDPRAYIYDLMSPAAQRKLLADMTPAQRTKFEKSIEIADKHGVVGDVRD